ncbi:hypothetical protein FACS1894126_5850 [Alphaproteobacteria bacterium]|nr:hypothetical protein FACS1894126_5850 [Alphaproteobacteria bacterium]
MLSNILWPIVTYQKAGAPDLQAVEELVKDFRKVIIETMYDEELKTLLGFSKNEGRPENSNNYRNGSYAKTVKSSAGEIELSVPRDRNGEFEPQIVKKYQTDIFQGLLILPKK